MCARCRIVFIVGLELVERRPQVIPESDAGSRPQLFYHCSFVSDWYISSVAMSALACSPGLVRPLWLVEYARL